MLLCVDSRANEGTVKAHEVTHTGDKSCETVYV